MTSIRVSRLKSLSLSEKVPLTKLASLVSILNKLKEILTFRKFARMLLTLI